MLRAFLRYCQYCAIAKPDIGGPQFRHQAAFLFSGCNDFCYIVYNTYGRIHETATKAVAALPQEEFVNICLLRKFRNFSVKQRWRPVVKHRQNVGKPSFRKLTMETPVEVTPRTALSNFVCVRCEFFGHFWRLVRTKIRPSSIIIRLLMTCHLSLHSRPPPFMTSWLLYISGPITSLFFNTVTDEDLRG